MPYEYLDEGVTADVSFRATAPDIDALFAAAADATANAMVENLEAVAPIESRRVELEADDLDILLYRFLGEMIFYKDAEGLISRAAAVRVERRGAGYRLSAELRGEVIDPQRHRPHADVKAVTLHGLDVARGDSEWIATATLDV